MSPEDRMKETVKEIIKDIETILNETPIETVVKGVLYPVEAEDFRNNVLKRINELIKEVIE